MSRVEIERFDPIPPTADLVLSIEHRRPGIDFAKMKAIAEELKALAMKYEVAIVINGRIY